jgi:hypothetical protein
MKLLGFGGIGVPVKFAVKSPLKLPELTALTDKGLKLYPFFDAVIVIEESGG